jgi:restriction system protein
MILIMAYLVNLIPDNDKRIKMPELASKEKEEIQTELNKLKKNFNSSQSTPTKNTVYIWNLELLKSLEWKRFEEICQKYISLNGDDARLTETGADKGIDIKVYKNGELAILIQCKAWKWKVGVKEIRELYGVMNSENVNKGVFMTTSTFTEEAINFRKNKKLILIDGNDLINRIKKLPAEIQTELLDIATKGDYTTPSCPRCDKKMVVRKAKNSDSKFWGCSNFPKCRYTLKMSTNCQQL